MAVVGYFSLHRPCPQHVRLTLATSRATMARTEATSQLMSAFAPISSGSPSASDVGGIPAKRGVLTPSRHSGDSEPHSVQSANCHKNVQIPA